MLFFCEVEELEGHPKPEHDHAIIEADSREQAAEKARRAFPGPEIAAIYLYEVPRERWAKIPTDLIDKRITKFVAEKLGIDGVGLVLSDAARAILAKFPGPVTLQPSKKIWGGVFLPLGLIFVAVGALPPLLLEPGAGWGLELYLAIGFFIVLGVFVMVAPVITLVKARMTLDAAGFEMRYALRMERRLWKDVRFFHPVKVCVIPMVGYLDSTRHDIWAERGLADVFSFGFTPDELAVLINAWRRRALSQNE